nr:uncharacterized protein LOC113713992 [Coffea arabica]
MTSMDIGWEHGKPVGGNRKIVRCNYYGKIMHGGITRLKEHVGHVIGQVEPCPRASSEVRDLMKMHLKVADNPYYQSMIDEIAKAGSGIKGSSAYQIGNKYLDEEFEELEKYLGDIYDKFSTFGCTLMCDGWSTHTKHPIINFMVYCDRHMIYHSSVDCTNIKKTAEYIFKLMDEVVEVVGEKNVVQVVTDSEPSMKAAGQLLMKKRKNLFWSPCAAHCIDLMLEDIGKMDNVKETIAQGKKITSFIYNSDKVVNLMKTYTKKRELLRPGITRFATEFISMESLLRNCTELKRMCTSDEWAEFNNITKRKTEAIKVAELILSEKFWKKVRNVCAIMEPLVKVLKTIDQDNKPTLPIIYEAMDRAKMAIQKSVKSWKTIWEVIDNRWYNQLHRDLHAAAYFLNPILQYSGTCEFNLDEVRRGLKNVIAKLEPNLDAQVDSINEIKIFADKKGGFGSAIVARALPKSLPESSEYQEHDNDGFGDTLSQYITKRNKKGLAASSSRKQKSKTKQTSKQTVPSSSNKSDSSNDDDDNGDNGDGGNNSFRHSGYNQDSQQAGGMSWAQGQDNYYATQDTDHGYRPGIEAQRQFLNDLTQFSSDDTFSHHSGSQRYRGVNDQMQNLAIYPTYEHESSQNRSTSQLGYGYDQSYGITPDYYSGYRPFDRPRQVERSTSIHGSGYYEKEIDKSHDGSSFDSNNIGFYGHDSTASYGTSDSVNYRGFGY